MCRTWQTGCGRATMGRTPGAGLMRELEGRAEEMTGTIVTKSRSQRRTWQTCCGRMRRWRGRPGRGGCRGWRGGQRRWRARSQEVAKTLWAYATMGDARGGADAGAGGAGGGGVGYVQCAGGGKDTVGVCEDGAGARGGLDAGAGGAGRGAGGHVHGAERGQQALGVDIGHMRRWGGSPGRA